VALVDERLALDGHLPLGRALAFWRAIDGTAAGRGDPFGLADLARRAGALSLHRAEARGAGPAGGAGADLAARRAAQRAGHRWAGRAQEAIEAHRAGGLVVIASHQPLALAGSGRWPWPTMFRLRNEDGEEETGMIARLWPIFRRDLALLLRGRRGARGGAALLFFRRGDALSVAVGPDARLLARTGAGVIWVAALLAAILPLDRLVEPDVEAGLFDQWALRGLSEEVLLMVRIVAHWISFGVPCCWPRRWRRGCSRSMAGNWRWSNGACCSARRAWPRSG
jgi:hypothetical protein